MFVRVARFALTRPVRFTTNLSSAPMISAEHVDYAAPSLVPIKDVSNSLKPVPGPVRTSHFGAPVWLACDPSAFLAIEYDSIKPIVVYNSPETLLEDGEKAQDGWQLESVLRKRKKKMAKHKLKKRRRKMKALMRRLGKA